MGSNPTPSARIGRARRGGSGALLPATRYSGVEVLLEAGLVRGQPGVRDDDDRIPRDGILETPPGPEGSNGNREIPGAAG